jgi:hypothetical protein
MEPKSIGLDLGQDSDISKTSKIKDAQNFIQTANAFMSGGP